MFTDLPNQGDRPEGGGIMAMEANFLIVGVGGQGTILAGDILSEVGMLAEFDSKKSDILGLAVRGGSVASHIRWGEKIGAPMNMYGTVDYLVASEPLEALRSIQYLRKNATVIFNSYVLQPMLVSTGQAEYPSNEEIHKKLEESSGRVITYDATDKAQKLGTAKVMNVMLLGTLSKLVGDEVPLSVWEDAVRKYVPEKAADLNIKAFYAGREMV